MMRIENILQGQTIQTYLLDLEAGTVCMWQPPEDQPTESGVSTGEVADFFSAMSMAQYISDSNPTAIGTETIDGNDCLVVEFISGDLTVQSWIWKEHNFLVRYDIIGADHTTTVEFKNIDFGDIPDSMFELP